MADIQRRLDRAVDSRAGLREELRGLNQDIAAADATAKEAKQTLRTAERRTAALTQQRRARQTELERAQARWAEYLRAVYINGGGENTELRLLLNQDDPNEIARWWTYQNAIAHERQRQFARLQASVLALKKVEAELSARTTELNALYRDQAQRRERLATLARQRRAVLAQLNSRIRNESAALIRARADERRIARLVEEVRTAVAAAPAPRNASPVAVLPPGGRFAAFKGRLPFPVAGTIRAKFGSARGADVRWKGIMVAAPPGTPVHSVFPGRVVYADWLRGFGQLLILEHDNGYMTLYGNGQALYKKVGERVNGGDVIGITGSTGGFPEPGLYFEIRRNGEPRNPLEWCRSTG